MVNTVDSEYTDEYVFDLDKGGPEAGFNIAFGMTYYDSNPTMLIEPEFGELRGRVRKWTPESNTIIW